VVVKTRNKSKVVNTFKVIRRFYERIGWKDKVEEIDNIFINFVDELYY